MSTHSDGRRWFVLAALAVASCSQGGSPQLAGPSAAAGSTDAGRAGVLAEGDVKVGTGTLTIEAVRMDRQTPTGVSVLRQYANPGQEYPIQVGETIELWVEWVRGGNNAPNNPRFLVDWGEGEIERFDFINCGSCLLKHTYPRPGRFTVKVTLDDRVGTTVTRTFVLYSVESSLGCGAPAGTDIFLGDAEEEDEGEDSSDFDNAETPALGPVEGANSLIFTCVAGSDDNSLETGTVGSHGEDDDLCNAHSHGDPVNLVVEVHDPDTNAWTSVFSQSLSDSNEFIFAGLAISFPRQKVDRVRLLSDPGQNQTYHSWGGASLTVSCQP